MICQTKFTDPLNQNKLKNCELISDLKFLSFTFFLGHPVDHYKFIERRIETFPMYEASITHVQ